MEDASEETQEVFKRPCIKCRKPFAPKDRKADWYCSKCRRELSKQSGIREVSVRVETDGSRLPGDFPGDD